MKKTLLILSMLSSATVFSQVIFSEGFDTFTSLAGAGWTSTNQSSPVGASTWAQGGGSAFSTGGQAGGTTSFTLCNFNSTTGAGTISNWLMTPPITVKNGDVISFYSRKGGTANTYPDRLEFRLSDQGASSTAPSGATGVGSYTNVAVSINPNLTTSTSATTGYPVTWTQYSYTVTGLSADTSMRMAFRYYVTNGGPDGTNSDIVGVDTFAVTRTATLATSDVQLQKSSISIYPTITDRELTISLKNNQQIMGISIYDMSGKAISYVKADVVDKSNSVVDVSQLPTGNYIVNVITKEAKYTSKFIKK